LGENALLMTEVRS